jgi:hypothetical protein
MRTLRHLALALVPTLLLACGDDVPPATTTDVPDAAPKDRVEPPDAAPDAAPMDAAPDQPPPPPDATPDAGPPPPDAEPDAGPPTDVAPDVAPPMDAAPDLTPPMDAPPDLTPPMDAPPDLTPPMDAPPDVGPELTCAPVQTRCGAACRDTMTDSMNCGGCDRRCCAGNVCVAGVCALACSPGNTACSAGPSPDGCLNYARCIDPRNDTMNCGMCGAACAAGQVCESGRCLAPCAMGQTRCGDACVDTASDARHCGACGRACGTDERCALGACRLPRTCDDLLSIAPGTPSGAYLLDPDAEGPVAPFRVFCDMETDGGGWTLVASSAGGTNMPRFETAASAPCVADSPGAPCFVGAAQLRALALVEYRWSNTAARRRHPRPARRAHRRRARRERHLRQRAGVLPRQPGRPRAGPRLERLRGERGVPERRRPAR